VLRRLRGLVALTRRLAGAIDRRPGRIVLAAVAFFVFAGALGASVANRLDPYSAEDQATESIRAKRELEHAGYRPPGVFVIVRDAPVGDPATRARVLSLERRLRRRGDVSSVSGYFDTGSRDFVSRDGRSTYVTVALRPTADREVQEAGKEIAASLAGERGALVGGPAVALAQTNEQIERDLRAAELLAFPLLFLLSLLFFRSFVAALLPLAIGALAITGTYLILRLLSDLTPISIFALNLTTGLGLGLAIDYSLFIVSRYREEIAKDGPGSSAMARVLGTAGRTVAFSALTVSVALASLLVFPQSFLYSMGLGGSLVVLLAAVVSLTVLPAILTLLGDRVDALAPGFLARRAAADAKPDPNGAWSRLARAIMRRPLPVAAACSVFLIVLGLPFLGIVFNTVDPTALPKEASARRAYEAVNSEFPPYRPTPFLLAISGGGPEAASRVAEEVRGMPGVATVDRPRRLGEGVTLLVAVSTSAHSSSASQDTVRRLRTIRPPPGATVLVGGESAEFVDFQSSLGRHLPYALAIIVGATLLILFAMTGSVILPVKTLLMNALNLSAVFGILVLIFQDGRLESLLGYTSNGSLEQTMPILLVAVVFGLSTDYAVFLLSRIKEAHDAGYANSEAVAMGLERTGRIVTAAALLFAVAMLAFATSEIVFIKENGIGAALAVLIDASIIRALLVPALMALLGKWNWWAPAAFRRLIPERAPWSN
jgi:uncharacterized membrane protein YdfJ with MMPL/SSD domain